MIRPGVPAELGTIREVLRRANDTLYDIARVAEEKCFEAGCAGPPAVHLYVEGKSIAGVAVTCGAALRLIAVDPGARGRGVGSALLRVSCPDVRIAFAEAGNYFIPGVPENDARLVAFLQARGFVEKHRTLNMEAPTAPHRLTPGIRRASAEEKDRVVAFVERHFGRVWAFEVSRAFEPALATVFVAEREGGIAGFAAHEANNRGLGTFGPTGVGPRFRGQGLGAALLRASLSDLHRLGYERGLIPWTDAPEFYRKACGATIIDRFVIMERSAKDEG